jgi:zinc protease
VDKRVKIGKLSNGMTYYICKNAKPAKRVELRLAVNAGAVQEDDNQLGMAHLVEHMCFNGTSHFPKNDLVHYLQSVGVGFGDGINGYTSFDETVYMLTVPSDSAKILDNGLLIMEDWANAVTFDTAEISKERGVVLEEWRLRLGAYQRMQNKYIPVLLKGSKYADRLPIGTKESILHTSSDNIKRFYAEWYRPDLMALIVVGDIDIDKIEQQIKTNFAKIKSPTSPRPKETYNVQGNTEPLVCVVSDKENTGTRIMLAYKTPSMPKKTIDDYKQSIICNMFCGMLNQRLGELTKKSDPPFLGTGSYYGTLWVRTCDAFQISISVKEDGADKGMKAVLTEVERVKRYGYTEPELDRFKKIYLKNAEKQYNERDKQESSNIVWEFVDNFLQNDPIPGVEFSYEFLKNNLGSITLADINKLASEWIKDKNEVAIIMGVEKEGVKMPSEQELKDNLSWSKTIKVDPYTENAIASSLMTDKPKPGKLISEKQITNTGIIEITLSNGVKVMLKPTDFKNDEILMKAFSEGGSSLFGPEYKLSAQFATSLISESGIGKFSKIDLDKVMAGKNASARPFIEDIKCGFNGNSSVADFETMLQLVYLYFTAPRRDEAIYNSVYGRYSAMYKNALANPSNYFFNQVQLKLYNNNPDAPDLFPVEKDWQQMSLDKAMEVYKRNFSNAGNFTFMFVGSFKVDQIKPLIETYLGGLPTGKHETFVDRGLRPIDGPANEVINRGNDPKTYVYLTFNGLSKWSKRDSHGLWSLARVMQMIYIDKLREEMSGVYGFGIQGYLDRFPYENYHFTMTIPCAPENADKLVKAVVTEMERIRSQGPTKEELQKEIVTQRRSIETEVKENSWWLSSIDRVCDIEKEFGRVEKPYELCEMLTPEFMKEMAVKYLDPKKMVRYTMYPENYKNESAQNK